MKRSKSRQPREINRIVAYYRLSKPKRGKTKNETIRDAYGIEDQKREVARISKQYNAPIVAEYVEIETGTRYKDFRPELEKAIQKARMHRATLVIGKQDRLARNLNFISNLMESGVHFIPADRPEQNRLETHIRATIDEDEAERISDRVVRGMAIARERGAKFGFQNKITEEKAGHKRGFLAASKAAAESRHYRTLKTYEFMMPLVYQMREDGQSYEVIAQSLNELGHTTSAMKPFSAMAVFRLIRLFGQSQPKPR